jgi:histidyl-tRNA synthetase
MAMTWLGDLGIRSLQLFVNSVGDHDDRPAYMEKLIEAQKNLLGEMSEDSRRRHEANPLRVFDSKDPQDQLLIEKFPTILDHLSPENRAHFDEVCAYLSDWGIDYTVEPRLVRGLDYYRRTVFEVTSSVLGAQDSLLGGGRYDGLVGQMGGDDIPGVGFAAGLERIVLALPEGAGAGPIDCYVVTVSPDLIPEAMKAMRDLRSYGLCCTADFQGRSMKAQMKAANRSNAPVTVIFGPDELSKGFCTLKMMESGEQREVSLEKLVEDLQRILHMGNLGN